MMSAGLSPSWSSIRNPDAARANCSILLNWLILCTALHFGGSFGPSNWEPVSWAHCEITVYLFKHCHYVQDLNKDVLKLIFIEPPKGRKSTKMTQANTDELNPPLDTSSDSFDIHYNMYVDDNLSAIIHEVNLIYRVDLHPPGFPRRDHKTDSPSSRSLGQNG